MFDRKSAASEDGMLATRSTRRRTRSWSRSGTDCGRELIPTKMDRYVFSTCQIQVTSSYMDWYNNYSSHYLRTFTIKTTTRAVLYLAISDNNLPMTMSDWKWNYFSRSKSRRYFYFFQTISRAIYFNIMVTAEYYLLQMALV